MGAMESLIILIPTICYIAAWVLTMQIVDSAAKEKGYGDLSGKLWFIGFFGFIFTPAIIVASLPDKKPRRAQVENITNVDDELPSL